MNEDVSILGALLDTVFKVCPGVVEVFSPWWRKMGSSAGKRKGTGARDLVIWIRYQKGAGWLAQLAP